MDTKEKWQYIRADKKYELGEVFSKILNGLPLLKKNKKRIDFDGDRINIKSARLTLFRKNSTCVKCGMEGQYFVKEKASKKEKHFHFNMYGINGNGEEVLFTKDHVIPKSKGGVNRLSNYQTMCIHCNAKKADLLEDEQEDILTFLE